MEKIKIIADSTCDLTDEILQKYNITVIPLCVIMGDATYQDGVNVTPEDIYEWSEKENSTPKTAAPLLNDVVDILKPFTEDKMDIVFIGISEDMSSTCNVVRLAAGILNYKKVHIINSGNLSTGIGLQVMKAAEMAEDGQSAESIEDYIVNTMQERVKASFIVDTLTYLNRGGRCSSVAALIGNTFQLKPMIVVKHGKMGVGKKYRGNIKKSLLNYVKDLKTELLSADKERVFITHSGCDDETVKLIYDYINNLHIFREIIITKAGGVISSHCGPKTLGVLFVS
ncbi:DegV family EDD domain-containing protein [Anaerocolumna sedimenticola]|uniref:DegV family EDD domain-containing protein n=1 Tax=Anaerocolumna sedimenticola TaxID=2696063 RepID=A0A6P1TN17_9FIRM|nr:DegV family protein [Anaerocolumna sedimenticola]QHQ62394.1 DegV family EDD domain-containing protein [Anaerocolumna sedimenticola]